MYAQVAIKPNPLLRNGAYGIVMRGVQKCTRGCSSLRGRNKLPLCCIKLDTATDPAAGKCGLFRDGQEFIIGAEEYSNMLNGKFCAEAWDCINRYIYAALQGGSIMDGWTRDEKKMIACCNDGTRPVIFKIERIDLE